MGKITVMFTCKAMSTCEVTGLVAHWEVTFDGGRVACFNGVRSMTNYLRQQGCNITQSNFFDLERGDPPSEKRLERFRRVGIKKIYKVRAEKYIMDE